MYMLPGALWFLLFLFSQCFFEKYVFSNYSGGRPVSILWRESPVFPPGNANYAAAAPTSALVAALTPLRWLLPCFPPLFVAGNSHYGGGSLASRRSFRRQFSQLRQF
jgi:hypothetical protein